MQKGKNKMLDEQKLIHNLATWKKKKVGKAKSSYKKVDKTFLIEDTYTNF